MQSPSLCSRHFCISYCSQVPLNGAGPVRLLTNPVAAGYVQNPISVYYCYAASTDGRAAEPRGCSTPGDSCKAQLTSTGRDGVFQDCAGDRPCGDCGTPQAASRGQGGGPQGGSAETRRDGGGSQAASADGSGCPQGRRAAGARPAGRLQRCIAEVTNTPWGARATFVFEPGEQAVPKAMHVSPLMDMHSTWCAGLLV